MIEALIIAGVLAASAILIYVGLKSSLKDSEDVQIRRMARTLVRSVEQRAEWDTTLNSRGDKWARIVLVLQDKFDVEDDWLHIIIGEAQFDMEAENVSKKRQYDNGIGTNPDLEQFLRGHVGRDSDSGEFSGRHPSDSRDGSEQPGSEDTAGIDYVDLGEDLPIPSAE